MEVSVFARLHARPGKQAAVRQAAAFERHAELPHTVRFVETVEPLLDHPFKATLSEQIW